MSVLETEVSGLIFQGDAKAIKIIHGHGTGALKMLFGKTKRPRKDDLKP